MQKKLPTISIISPTYNCNIPLFKKSLQSIKMQEYPKKKIEHIIIDAGSKNETVKIAKSFGCKIIKRPDLLFESQTRMSLGIKKAKGTLILIFEADNIMMGKDWLLMMVEPFLKDDDIFCTFSMYNGYFKNMSPLTKYCALFGVNDALLYYLKSEKNPRDESTYKKGKVLFEDKNFYKVEFNLENLPPLGDNGFLVKKDILEKANKKPEQFIHVDAFAQLLKKGYSKYGVVKNSIVHEIGSSVFELYKRRVAIKSRFYDDRRMERSYLVFNPNSRKDRVNLMKFVIYSLTIIVPLARSIKGYMKIREVSWFLHPLVCLVALTFYTYSELFYIIRSRIGILPSLSRLIIYEKRS